MWSASRRSQPVRSFRDLRVWQEAMQLSAAVHLVGMDLMRLQRCAMADQLTRAATSVHANVAEGWGRHTPRDRQRFYTIAWASLLEVESLLAEVARSHPLLDSTLAICATHTRHVGRLLAALRRATDELTVRTGESR
ncbi:MAG: four helix bundle protein [Gemmatirosa sp.]